MGWVRRLLRKEREVSHTLCLHRYSIDDSSVQWRLPLALACFTPALTLAGAYWIPESPRYLCWVNKKDEAWEILRRLHEDPSDLDEAAARAEFAQIVLQVEHDKEQKATYINMFRKPSWRKRSLISIFLL